MFDNEKLAQKNGTSATIRMSDWFKLSLLSLIACIPFIGFIIYLILILKIAFGGNTAPSMKNFILLQLIISAIVLLIAALALAFCMPTLINAFDSGSGSLAVLDMSA